MTDDADGPSNWQAQIEGDIDVASIDTGNADRDNHLRSADFFDVANHPKIAPTREKALELWRAGEKVLIFCHFRHTGRALRRHISADLEAWVKMGAPDPREKITQIRPATPWESGSPMTAYRVRWLPPSARPCPPCSLTCEKVTW